MDFKDKTSKRELVILSQHRRLHHHHHFLWEWDLKTIRLLNRIRSASKIPHSLTFSQISKDSNKAKRWNKFLSWYSDKDYLIQIIHYNLLQPVKDINLRTLNSYDSPERMPSPQVRVKLFLLLNVIFVYLWSWQNTISYHYFSLVESDAPL